MAVEDLTSPPVLAFALGAALGATFPFNLVSSVPALFALAETIG